MRLAEFLGAVLPAEGYIMLATPFTKAGYQHVALEDVEGVKKVAGDWRSARKHVYFGIATYARPRVYNKAKERWQYRTQNNVLRVKSLFLDIDIKGDDQHHRTYEDARTALKGLRQFGMPKPLVVSTGGGLHCYWPLADEVEPHVWRPVAEQFKAITVALGIHADHSITADCARILRLPGTWNVKYDPPRPVKTLTPAPEALPLDEYARMFCDYIDGAGITPPAPPRHRATAGAALPAGNLGTTNDPANLNAVVFSCAFMQKQVVTRGAGAREPEWRAAVGVARFCEPTLPALRAVSDGHDQYSEAELQAKAASAFTEGPPTCAYIGSNKIGHDCSACPHLGKITTPLQLGREIVEAAPVRVLVETDAGVQDIEVPKPPPPYLRSANRAGTVEVVVESEDTDGRKLRHVVCPYDFYPVRILRQTGGEVAERSVWRMHLPRMTAPVEVVIAQGLITDARRLHEWAMHQGMYLDPKQAKDLQPYMSAYLRTLSEAVDRAKVYERLGWHDDHHTFALPLQVFHRDGTVVPHAPTLNLRRITKDSFRMLGTHAAWLDAMRFYGGSGMEPYRAIVYGSYAAPLFHMTGYKGVLVGATGETGRGKTTALEAAASVWGEPDGQKISGSRHGATTNALYNALGTLHSLPMIWDETTERDTDEKREFLLDISQGKGKERMKGNEHDGRVVTWETVVLSSANTDDVSRLLTSGKDSDPHLMRLVSIDFTNTDVGTAMKHRADDFRRAIHDNYGHAGPVFIKYVAANYDKVRERVIAVSRQLERDLGAKSQERYWTATVACMIVGGEIAYRLHLLPFSPKADLDWLKRHVSKLRETIADARVSPENLIVQFLETFISQTLVVSGRMASNLSDVADDPRYGLVARVELDVNTVYVARHALYAWCEKQRVNQSWLENALTASGALVNRNVQKVLGAGTKWARGQTRCWKLDDRPLGNVHHTMAQALPASPASGNVVNLPPRRAVP